MVMKELGIRLGALIWMWTGGAVILALVLIYGTIYAILDILWRAFGQDGFGSGSTIAPISSGIYWWIALAETALLGRGGFRWVPDPTPG